MKILLGLVFLALVTIGLAQPVPPAPPPEARQFDFWLGEWEVFRPDGKRAGSSRIESIAGGWGLLENWMGAGGVAGKSLNTWRADKQSWQQFWVGAGGSLELAGGLDAHGAMILSGTSVQPDGSELHERITWTPNPDGTVRQLWEQSVDGATWTVAFDGLYRHPAP